MNEPLRFRVAKWYQYLASALIWGVAIYSPYLLISTAANIKAKPYLLIPFAGIWFSLYLAPKSFSNLLIEIRLERDELVFTTFGRLPFMPFGHQRQELRLPITTTFEWSRPDLYATTPDGAWYSLRPATLFRKSTLVKWFTANGLPKPKGT